MKFRKKPVVIEAVQYAPTDIQKIWDEFGAADIYGPTEQTDSAFISTLEGRMEVRPGDWIIRGVKGELYPCKPDIFALTYEPVENETREDAQDAQATNRG